MSRYKNSRIATNKNEMYLDVFEEKGVKKIIQFRTYTFKKVPQEVLDSIKSEEYFWKYGDTYWSLASKYYGDPNVWWIIAGFNRKPTEASIKLGEMIKIPLSVSQVMQVL